MSRHPLLSSLLVLLVPSETAPSPENLPTALKFLKNTDERDKKMNTDIRIKERIKKNITNTDKRDKNMKYRYKNKKQRFKK